MAEPWDDFVGRLDQAVGRFDREAARRLAYELTGKVHQGEILPATTAARILGKLRRKRFSSSSSSSPRLSASSVSTIRRSAGNTPRP